MINKDFATSLQAFMQRSSDSIIDVIAKDGLKTLKSVLDSSGFADSDQLKNYQVFAHVTGGSVLFEILLDADAVEPENEAAQKDMDDMAAKREIMDAARSYGLLSNEPVRLSKLHDARKPAQDARKPAKDARKKVSGRLIDHEILSHAPRSMSVNRSGKLSISFKRSLRQASNGSVHMPQGKFQGIPKEFISRLEKVLTTKFAPALREMIERFAL